MWRKDILPQQARNEPHDPESTIEWNYCCRKVRESYELHPIGGPVEPAETPPAEREEAVDAVVAQVMEEQEAAEEELEEVDF
jgi:hypothetical protein